MWTVVPQDGGGTLALQVACPSPTSPSSAPSPIELEQATGPIQSVGCARSGDGEGGTIRVAQTRWTMCNMTQKNRAWMYIKDIQDTTLQEG